MVRPPCQKEVYKIIKKAGTISLKEIRSSTDMNYNSVRGAVIRLTNDGLIERVGYGVYKIKKS